MKQEAEEARQHLESLKKTQWSQINRSERIPKLIEKLDLLKEMHREKTWTEWTTGHAHSFAMKVLGDQRHLKHNPFKTKYEPESGLKLVSRKLFDEIVQKQETELMLLHKKMEHETPYMEDMLLQGFRDIASEVIPEDRVFYDKNKHNVYKNFEDLMKDIKKEATFHLAEPYSNPID